MGAGESGEDYFSVQTGNKIRILQQGVYAVTMHIAWVEANVGDYWLCLSKDWGHIYKHYGKTITATDVSMTASQIIRLSEYPDFGNQLSLQALHVAATDKNIDGAYLEVIRLGDYTGTDIESMNPDY